MSKDIFYNFQHIQLSDLLSLTAELRICENMFEEGFESKTFFWKNELFFGLCSVKDNMIVIWKPAISLNKMYIIVLTLYFQQHFGGHSVHMYTQ